MPVLRESRFLSFVCRQGFVHHEGAHEREASIVLITGRMPAVWPDYG